MGRSIQNTTLPLVLFFWITFSQSDVYWMENSLYGIALGIGSSNAAKIQTMMLHEQHARAGILKSWSAVSSISQNIVGVLYSVGSQRH
jgi:hypothetical protein